MPQVNGHDWSIRRRLLPKDSEWCGFCRFEDHEIFLDPHLKGRELLETLIHELIHAAAHWLSESVVDEFARVIADDLWRRRWRLRDGAGDPAGLVALMAGYWGQWDFLSPAWSRDRATEIAMAVWEYGYRPRSTRSTQGRTSRAR